jgi:glycerol-3-phosphate dehydrogenase (NAD(P)+)
MFIVVVKCFYIMENITILGCGRWASFHAWYQTTKLKNKVLMWGRVDTIYEDLSKTHKNSYVELPQSVKFTNDLNVALNFAEIIIISITAQGMRDLTANISKCNPKNKIFVLCMKGIDCETGERLTEILRKGVDVSNKICVWVGPGHTQELTKGQPNIMVMSGDDERTVAKIINKFANPLIRFYQSDDLIGTEVGAALKNVIGVAGGFLDGAGLSSLKGALMSRGIYEVSVLCEKMGGNRMTPFGISHLGDFEATLFNQNSHNRGYGEKFMQCYLNGKNGFSADDFHKTVGTAEGVATTKAVYNLSKKFGIEMPITTLVYNILYCNAEPMKELKKLFMRPELKEFRYEG